jgi:hypothetical protein
LKQSPWRHAPSLPNVYATPLFPDAMASRVLVWSLFSWTSRSYGATAPKGK